MPTVVRRSPVRSEHSLRFMLSDYTKTLPLILLLGGCATEDPRATEFLDPQTAVTIRQMSEPIVYAHEVPAIAANVRDYVSLGAVEVNNMGSRKHYLVAVSWTTVDRRASGARAPVADRLELTVGSRTLEFAPVGHEARPLGIGEPPYRPPSGYVGESWYAVTPAELHALAASPPAELTLNVDGDSLRYATWRGASAQLQDFVRDIPQSATSGARR